MTSCEASLFFIFLNSLFAFYVQVVVLFVLFTLCMGYIRLENESNRMCSSAEIVNSSFLMTEVHFHDSTDIFKISLESIATHL